MPPAADPLDPQVRRAFAAAADGIERDVEAIAARMAFVLHRDIPELLDDPGSIEASERADLEIIRAFLRMLRRGQPLELAQPVPESLAAARALARADQGVRPLLRICHIGHGAFLEAWGNQLGRLDLEPRVQLAATRAFQQLTFGWVDAFGQRLADEYERERERLGATATSERATLIRGLVAGESPDPSAASRVLGYDLARHHTALVLWTADEPDAGARLDGAAQALADELGGGRPLLLAVAGTVTWAWVGTTEPPAVAIVHPRPDGVSVAVGGPAPGAAGFRSAHRDADDAFRVALLGARRPGSVVTYGRVELAALLSTDLERARRFVRTQLGELARADDEHARLRATLLVYLDEQGSRQATARRLGVHANTVGNRVRACAELLGTDVSGRGVELQVALTLAQQLGAGVLE